MLPLLPHHPAKWAAPRNKLISGNLPHRKHVDNCLWPWPVWHNTNTSDFPLAVSTFLYHSLPWSPCPSQEPQRAEVISSVQSLSRVQLCDPMNRSTPGLPVHHQLPEFTQTHVHRVSDAIQPSHPLSSPSSPAPNPSQHQSLFQWVNSSQSHNAWWMPRA